MQMIGDSRKERNRRHEQDEMLTCLIIGYASGHTTLRRALGWCRRNISLLREGMALRNGIASVSTVSRMLNRIDMEMFLSALLQWVHEIVKPDGKHIAIDGKMLRGSVDRAKGERSTVLMNAIDTVTGLVLAQLPVKDKGCEITGLPEILRLLELKGNVVTIDAIGTHTSIMEEIIGRGGHFVLTVKDNQEDTKREIMEFFADPECRKSDKYDKHTEHERNRERQEYRVYEAYKGADCISRKKEDWPFLSTIGKASHVRILKVKDSSGDDVTPSREVFLKKGSRRQPLPVDGTEREDAVQVTGMISDLELDAEEMGRYKRDHWKIENTLHHVLDDTFREDRSPARGTAKINLALVRKFAYNILRLIMNDGPENLTMTETMDRFSEDRSLIRKYVFNGLVSQY